MSQLERSGERDSHSNKKAARELEAEFEANLARLYTKAAHKSGVQGCHKLIDEHCHSSSNVHIFLNSLSKKQYLEFIKSS